MWLLYIEYLNTLLISQVSIVMQISELIQLKYFYLFVNPAKMNVSKIINEDLLRLFHDILMACLRIKLRCL